MPHVASVGFTLALLSLPLLSASHAQTCSNQLRQAAARQASYIVSAADTQVPRKAWEHFEKARTASEKNDSKRVALEIAKALNIAPRFAEAYVLLGAQQVRDQQYEAALQTIVAGRSISPNLSLAGVVVASALNQLGRFDDAVAELERASSQESATWQAKFERARAETGRRDAEAALYWSELAVDAAPVGCTSARLVRANAFRIAGRPAEAAHELEMYLQLDRQGTNHEPIVAALQQLRSTEDERQKALLALR